MREEGTGNGEQGLVKVLFWFLAIGAFCVLGAAAVWMGGLNQDEGWYLYASNLVAEGQVLYRDFAYTQGPMLPVVYSAFSGVWKTWGLLGARILTLAFGLVGILFAVGLAYRLASEGRKGAAALATFLLLGCNLYHLYYVAIPKTYALAALFVSVGFYMLVRAVSAGRTGAVPLAVVAGLSLALGAGTRISLGALLCVAGCWLVVGRRWRVLTGFCLGGFGGLSLVYLPYLLDPAARAGLMAAQAYHAARGGFDVVWTVGSFSRLVRWYLPVFVVLGLGVAGVVRTSMTNGTSTTDRSPSPFALRSSPSLLLWGFLAVFAVQMLAPFPYEDYQVPVMGLLAVYAVVMFMGSSTFKQSNIQTIKQFSLLLVLGLSFATSFGSPLLEKWMTNGQDRFWSLKKQTCELAQLRDVAKRIEQLDPGGKTLLTQDTYLAVETNRKVPKGLEMGPFAILSDAEWRQLLGVTAPAECAVAALSGYSFSVEPPVCNERSVETQMEYWSLLKRKYELASREESFGQNATPLLILKRK